MKKIVYCIMGLGILLSCSGDGNSGADTEILGKWQLFEQLLDPGDGSGTFQAVDSELLLEFFDNGTIVSVNGSLCNIVGGPDDTSSGTFSLEDNTVSIGCTDEMITIAFQKSGSDLILNFFCIEACAQKYRRVP